MKLKSTFIGSIAYELYFFENSRNSDELIGVIKGHLWSSNSFKFKSKPHDATWEKIPIVKLELDYPEVDKIICN